MKLKWSIARSTAAAAATAAAVIVAGSGCAAEAPAVAPPVVFHGPRMADAKPPESPAGKKERPGVCGPAMTIDAAQRAQLIDRALASLRDEYVFPDMAAKMEASIRAHQKAGDYDKVTGGVAIAELLTNHLQAVSHDKHLHMDCFAFREAPNEDDDQPEEAPQKERRLSFERRVNHGFEKVERMDGNIGYIEMRGFMDPATGGDTAAAAMNFVADTDALIIDLRRNGGGEASMVAFVSSYLFDAKPVHLNDLVWRKDNRVEQFWTVPHVPGKRLGISKPVYVLTSSDTFSAAEEFTYNLKNQKRATIVGETTGGGAHPGGYRRLIDHFAVWLPRGRAMNPISKTNWEGTGVSPDVAVPKDQALKTAYLLALRGRVEKEDDPALKANLQSIIRQTEADLAAIKSAKKP